MISERQRRLKSPRANRFGIRPHGLTLPPASGWGAWTCWLSVVYRNHSIPRKGLNPGE